MRSRILKKINPLHSKIISNLKNNNENNNKNRIESNDSNNNNNSYNDIIKNDENISIDNEDNYLTIEKDKNDAYNINMEKIRALSDNLNNSNIINRNKKEYIFIKNNKELFKSNITSKKNIKKEMLININDSNTFINNAHKKLFQKNMNENIKNNDESNTSLNEINTIRDDESIDFEPFLLNKKIINENENIKKNNNNNNKIDIKDDFILKNSNTENNTKKKYKQNNMKINKKCIRKKRNIINNIIMIEEEEKTIEYNNKKTNFEDIKIMNYFQKIINNNNFQKITNNNNNNNNKNINNNINDNNINIENKNICQNIDIFHSNDGLFKNKELNKKTEKIRIKGNIKNIIEKKEIKINPKKQNINSKKFISNDKLIKTNLISNKNLNMKIMNKRYYNEDENNKKSSNNSINNINKDFLMKNKENTMNLMNKMKKTEINNSLDFSSKKNELNQINSNNYSNSSKKNNILIINTGNNNKSEKRINPNLNNIKNITRLKSVEKNIRNEISKKNSIPKNNNCVPYKFTKKNKTYFISNKTQKGINNSTNDIHKIKDKNEITKNNQEKKINNKSKINKSNNNNNINSQISNYLDPKISKHFNVENNGYILINSFKTNENFIKRSISPNMNNFYFYSKMDMNNTLNKKQELNNNKELLRNEEKKHNMNIKYSNKINNLETDTYYHLNETIIDKFIKNSDYLFNNNNCFTYTKGNKHVSPLNNFKTKKMFSSFTNKNMNNTNNLSSNYNINKRSSIVLKKKNKIKKNKIKINVDNILNTNYKNQININKEKIKKEVQTLSNKKSIKKNGKNKNIKKGSFIDSQILLVPEENTQVILLKTMKYNLCSNSNRIMFFKIQKTFKNDKIINSLLLYLTNNDLFNLSLVNKFFLKITKRKILKIIMNKILYNINNKNLLNNIWNNELLKYSNFNNIHNFENIYQNYINISNKYDQDIIKDLLRTFPKDNKFHKGSDSYNKLFNILKSYSNYNKEIGYAQGMNFIVAKLIVFFKTEKKSFIYLDSLFKKLKMANVIGISNNLENKMKVIQFLLKKICPEIVIFLERKKINHEIFTASWFITLFSKNFKFDNLLLIIWNFSIIFGWKFIFLFTISVLIIFKDKYFKLDLYDFTQFMKNIFIYEYFKNRFNDIMRLVFYYISQWKNIIKDIKMDCFDENKKKRIKKISKMDKLEDKTHNFNSSNKNTIDKEYEEKETN